MSVLKDWLLFSGRGRWWFQSTLPEVVWAPSTQCVMWISNTVWEARNGQASELGFWSPLEPSGHSRQTVHACPMIRTAVCHALSTLEREGHEVVISSLPAWCVRVGVLVCTDLYTWFCYSVWGYWCIPTGSCGRLISGASTAINLS